MVTLIYQSSTRTWLLSFGFKSVAYKYRPTSEAAYLCLVNPSTRGVSQ